MKNNKTNEFSFILKPSKHGIGVFATHNIKNGTLLRLFGKEKLNENRVRMLNKLKVPKLFHEHCIDRGKKIMCPEDFGNMPVGWYLNHSRKPNAIDKNYHWYAARDIKDGEEILIDYNSLEEPEEGKEKYY